MENLTKENFWNALTEKYPEQMKQFCAWIDEYKNRVNWDSLFSGIKLISRKDQDEGVKQYCNHHNMSVPDTWCYAGDLIEEVGTKHVFICGNIPKEIAEVRRRSKSFRRLPSQTPKYHELPIAMQFGIFVQFTSESNWKYSFSMLDHPYPDETSFMITRYFEENKPE
jgi:hypothetical protein